MRKAFGPHWILCGSLCLAVLAGCLAGMPSERRHAASSRAVTIRREYLPPFGGQTIRPPQRMADVTTLWMPLTREEYSRLAAHGGPSSRPSRACSPVSAWLPPSGRTIMEEYLYRLTVSQKAVTARVLERAGRVLPMIRTVLKEQDLPPELAALPFVESAFETKAVSRAGAAGLWQLMPVTARRFGLIVDASQDERFDPRKATEAATRYLRYLYGRFRNWPLALAAYNCGEGAMDALLRRYGANTLDELCVVGRASVPQETLQFVPKFVAAATVMHPADQYAPQDKPSAPRQTRPPQNRIQEENKPELFRKPAFSEKDAPLIPTMRRISR